MGRCRPSELEDVGDGRLGVSVGERELGGLHLGEELTADREVEPAELCSHRFRRFGTDGS